MVFASNPFIFACNWRAVIKFVMRAASNLENTDGEGWFSANLNLKKLFYAE